MLARATDVRAAQLFEQAALYEQSGDFPAALRLLDQLIDAYPAVASLYLKRGTIQWSGKNFEKAIESFDQAARLEPGNADTFFCRATAHQSRGDGDRAMIDYERALAIRPQHLQALNNKGVLLREAGRVREAITTYEHAIDADPNCSEAWVGKALCELLVGQYQKGWHSYEWRKKRFGPWGTHSSAPEWRGEPLAGKTLLIQAEQGLGDTVQFCRYAKLAKEAGAQVILQVQDRLVRLISTLDRDIAVIPGSNAAPACDYRVMLLSLPAILETREATVPSDDAYLTAVPELVAQWKDRIGPSGFRIGIHWQGEQKWDGVEKPGDRERSFPLRHFHGISQIPGVRLISLQKNDGLDQLTGLPDGMRVELPGEFDAGADAFLDSAAIIANLDLVITSDTAMAHVASALGCPVWLVVQHVPDWRWQLDRHDCPWYPKMRLFRQTERGNWSAVFDSVHQMLPGVIPQ